MKLRQPGTRSDIGEPRLVPEFVVDVVDRPRNPGEVAAIDEVVIRGCHGAHDREGLSPESTRILRAGGRTDVGGTRAMRSRGPGLGAPGLPLHFPPHAKASLDLDNGAPPPSRAHGTVGPLRYPGGDLSYGRWGLRGDRAISARRCARGAH